MVSHLSAGRWNVRVVAGENDAGKYLRRPNRTPTSTRGKQPTKHSALQPNKGDSQCKRRQRKRSRPVLEAQDGITSAGSRCWTAPPSRRVPSRSARCRSGVLLNYWIDGRGAHEPNVKGKIVKVTNQKGNLLERELEARAGATGR